MENARYIQLIFSVNGTLSLYWTIWGLIINEIYLVISGIPFVILSFLGIYFSSKSISKIEVNKTKTEPSIRGRI